MSDNLKFIVGDLFTTKLRAIGHGVNIYGVMGAGIAVIIRRLFPAVFAPYRAKCLAHELIPGAMLPVEVEPNMWILNLASQDKPGPNARLSWFESSLRSSFGFVQEHNLGGFAIPRIASDIGGLNWADVKEVIINVAQEFPDVTLEVYSLPDAKD
jgi:O-acetyl-ADP-ribose deacetylase (regulator of RNase III)